MNLSSIHIKLVICFVLLFVTITQNGCVVIQVLPSARDSLKKDVGEGVPYFQRLQNASKRLGAFEKLVFWSYLALFGVCLLGIAVGILGFIFFSRSLAEKQKYYQLAMRSSIFLVFWLFFG